MNAHRIKELFNLFISHDEVRPGLQSPWRTKDFYFATDAHMLIALPRHLADVDFADDDGKRPNAAAVIPIKRNGDLTADVNMLDVAIQELGIESIGKCDLCNGSGEVECEYHFEHECPECDGKGKIDRASFVSLWGCVMVARHIKIPITACRLIGVDQIIRVYGEQGRGCLFFVGDFQILIMTRSGVPEDVIHEITPTEIKP